MPEASGKFVRQLSYSACATVFALIVALAVFYVADRMFLTIIMMLLAVVAVAALSVIARLQSRADPLEGLNSWHFNELQRRFFGPRRE